MTKSDKIKKFEVDYHNDLYSHKKLFTPGSWLANPVNEVLEACELLTIKPNQDINILDLGCGVGRHSIALAKKLASKDARIFCLDFLPLAITKLREYSREHDVERNILPINCDIEEFIIKPEYYHFILSVSCIEHLPTRAKFLEYIDRIKKGTSRNGLNFIMINTNVEWINKKTNRKIKSLIPFELQTEETIKLLRDVYRGWDIKKMDIKKSSVQEKYKDKLIDFKSDFIILIAIKK
jgi:2-polyprenyl-3-methyl-5-hydroxy-6-metoxy-1,4-benzoquinol methylase